MYVVALVQVIIAVFLTKILSYADNRMMALCTWHSLNSFCIENFIHSDKLADDYFTAVNGRKSVWWCQGEKGREIILCSTQVICLFIFLEFTKKIDKSPYEILADKQFQIQI